MELWLKKIFVLFPWLIARIMKPLLPDDHPVKKWTWTNLAEGGTSFLYFLSGWFWFNIVVFWIIIKILTRR